MSIFVLIFSSESPISNKPSVRHSICQSVMKWKYLNIRPSSAFRAKNNPSEDGSDFENIFDQHNKPKSNKRYKFFLSETPLDLILPIHPSVSPSDQSSVHPTFRITQHVAWC